MKSSGRLLVQSPESPDTVFTGAVLDLLRSERQDSPDKPESGGVLLGSLSSESCAVFIENLSRPMEPDRQSRFGFFRSHRHNEVAASYWKKREETGTYLGLWHTHPEPIPTPSSTDRADWGKALKKDRYFSNCLFFLIVGTEALGIWVGSRVTPPRNVGEFYWEDKGVKVSDSNSDET